MIKAIVYESKAGHTKEYAQLLSQRTSVPAYSTAEAGTHLQVQDEIFFMGWVMGGHTMGLEKIKALYQVRGACAVSMSFPSEKTLHDLTANHQLPDSVKPFCLQGGFELEKLRGFPHFIMKCMRKSMIKSIMKQPSRTAEDDKMVAMLQNGASCVSADNLAPILAWWPKAEEKEAAKEQG